MILNALRRPRAGAAVLAGALALAGCVVSADATEKKAPVPTGAAKGVSTRPMTGAIGARSTAIMGSAWEADNTPIPLARLRLRNVVTGKIHAHTVADAAGQFAFHGVEVGSYVVELVSEGGRILTVGHTFTVAPGETVATFVRLGTRIPWFQGFFGNAASAVAATAASAGVTAVAPEKMSCVSPPCSTGGGSQ
jgi:hypothetical protein